MTIEELIEEFEILESDKERTRFLLELGRELPKLPEEVKTEENRVYGCQNNVWLVPDVAPANPPVVRFVANADGQLASGLVAIVTIMYSGRTAQEILDIDEKQVFASLGLDRFITPLRRNGLHGMVERIKAIASSALQ
jgi:cysteine desulfuration protein SufE